MMPDSTINRFNRRAALSGAAVLLGSMLGGCGFVIRRSSGPPSFSPEELEDTAEFSTLDELGVARAKASNSLRFDFCAGSIAKSDVGLPDSAYAPDVVANTGEKFRLSIKGSAGTLEAETDHVRFVTTDDFPVLTIITYFLTTESYEDYVRLIRDAVVDYGFDPVPVEAWIEQTSRDHGGDASFVVGEGNTLGFYVSYDLRYDGRKKVQVIIVQVSR
ncbi:hypothetical protein [Paeniglutamicibacter cryotolerans]|uniref:Uncharacterized protein n=1 Tax=Paeniglutamicibacter cryotolerans TaxID=670079 RepID=A0A839QLW0_9MICC|nr:hypothetical protein [Paeniglutamicibacter cryotolerans]MBB2996593.1 hypothetical protein [Paeniglutamicibacter cryotolerans]